MKKLLCVVVVLAVLTAAIAAIAADTSGTCAKTTCTKGTCPKGACANGVCPKGRSARHALKPRVMGVVQSAVKDGDTLASFVVKCPCGKTVTVSVTDKTHYANRAVRKPASASDVVVGATVIAIFDAAPADGKGTAVDVAFPKAPAAK